MNRVKFHETKTEQQFIRQSLIPDTITDLEDGDIGLLSAVLRREQHGVLLHN
jgi:hypothetical protein